MEKSTLELSFHNSEIEQVVGVLAVFFEKGLSKPLLLSGLSSNLNDCNLDLFCNQSAFFLVVKELVCFFRK